VSEYQYYEFLAIDRPLNAAEQAQVRSLSTRARITSTSFVNEYHWGDFRGDPNRLMERYYDAHLYVANWGTHRVMLRLPCDLLDPDVVEEYCVGEQLTAWVTDEFIVLDFTSQDHAGEFGFDYDAEVLLSAIAGVRAELAAGDLRPLYVAWLAAQPPRTPRSSWHLTRDGPSEHAAHAAVARRPLPPRSGTAAPISLPARWRPRRRNERRSGATQVGFPPDRNTPDQPGARPARQLVGRVAGGGGRGYATTRKS
jgi:hypothetical protein